MNRGGIFGVYLVGTMALLGDGGGRILHETFNPKTLRKLFTRDGGEPISPDEF